MSEYFFISNNITEAQVKAIIGTAGYVPGDYQYAPMLGHAGYSVTGQPPMSTTSLRNAATRLGITVEITSGAEQRAALSGNGHAGNGHAGNGRPKSAAESTVYTLDFINDTPDAWVFSVYQTLPQSPGLSSLSWKQTTVPRGGESGVQWTTDYLVAILNYRQIGGKGVYKAAQKLATSLGVEWNAVFQGGTQQLVEAGSAPRPEQVVINNLSGELADLGIGMDGDVALVQPQVYSGAKANFEVKPTYWVAMYKDIVKGEVISDGQVAGPLKVEFTGGATSLTYRAWTENGKLFFKEVNGAAVFQAPLGEAISRAQVMHERAALTR